MSRIEACYKSGSACSAKPQPARPLLSARSSRRLASPIAWGELKGFDNAQAFSIGDAKRLLDRAESKGLAGWGFAEQALPDL